MTDSRSLSMNKERTMTAHKIRLHPDEVEKLVANHGRRPSAVFRRTTTAASSAVVQTHMGVMATLRREPTSP